MQGGEGPWTSPLPIQTSSLCFLQVSSLLPSAGPSFLRTEPSQPVLKVKTKELHVEPVFPFAPSPPAARTAWCTQCCRFLGFSLAPSPPRAQWSLCIFQSVCQHPFSAASGAISLSLRVFTFLPIRSHFRVGRGRERASFLILGAPCGSLGHLCVCGLSKGPELELWSEGWPGDKAAG